MQVTLNSRRAYWLVDTLIERLEKGWYPFDVAEDELPQNMIPQEIREDEVEFARFLFYVCIYMRGRIKSKTVFKNLLRMKEEYPKLFSPEDAAEMNKEEIAAILGEFVGWDKDNAAKFWKENSRRLAVYWDSNPLSVIRGVRDYDEAVERFANLTEEGPKQLPTSRETWDFHSPRSRTVSSSSDCSLLHFLISKAVNLVVIYHPCRLHVCVNNCRAHKFKATFF